MERPRLGAMTAEGGSPIELDADGYLIHPLLAAGPRLSLWRAPTDNDRFGGLAARWQSAGLADLRPGPASIEREGASVIVHREVEVGARRVAHRQTFTPLPDGGIQVAEEAVIPPGLDDLPRVGTVLELIPGLEQVEWFGIGPHESLPRPQAFRPRGPLALDGRRTSSRPTSGHRRPAAAPMCAGSNCATKRARAPG